MHETRDIGFTSTKVGEVDKCSRGRTPLCKKVDKRSRGRKGQNDEISREDVTTLEPHEAIVAESRTPPKEAEEAHQRGSRAEPEQRAPLPESLDNAAGGRIGCSFCSRSYKYQKHANEHMKKMHKT